MKNTRSAGGNAGRPKRTRKRTFKGPFNRYKTTEIINTFQTYEVVLMGKSSALYGTPRTNPADVTDVIIPLSYFVDHDYLTPGQALSFYLVDEVKLSFTDAAILLKKNEATIRLGYMRALELREQRKAEEARKRAEEARKKEEAARKKRKSKMKQAAEIK